MKLLVQPNDPVLVKVADPIPQQEITTLQTQALIKDLLEVGQGNRQDTKKKTVVGLAAPQIGISKRIIAIDPGADGKGTLTKLKVYINPEITWKSQETTEWYEACWSTDKVAGIVSRPTAIKIKAFTIGGKLIEEAYSGYTARIFQHEIDHLDGHVFIDRIEDDNKLYWVEPNEFVQFRNNKAWCNWPNKCSRDKWNKIKGLKTS